MTNDQESNAENLEKPSKEEIHRLADEMARAFVEKCGGRVTELDIARVVEADIAAIREILPTEQAERLVAQLRAIWQDAMPSRN